MIRDEEFAEMLVEMDGGRGSNSSEILEEQNQIRASVLIKRHISKKESK